jgi:type IX secretion system PorP/SprF family membrane protein
MTATCRCLLYLIFTVLATATVKVSFAQDPQFGHFYSNSLLYNPAFTGNVDLGRFSLGYRNQWPGISKFVSYAASYDHYLHNVNSGIGVQFIKDEAGSGGLTTNMVNLLYSYQIRTSRRTALMAGLKGGYANRKFDFNKFTFADQIARDDAPTSNETGFRNQINYPNFGAGVVFFHSEKYWGGFALDHINKPENSFGNQQSYLPIQFNAQAGYNMPVENTGGRAYSTVTFAALYKAQQKWDQLDIGAYYKSGAMLLGLWYRGLPLKSNRSSIPNVDALLLMAGFKADRISFAYSYDITLSPLAGRSGGSHEISVILEYPKPKRRRRKFFMIPCPKF